MDMNSRWGGHGVFKYCHVLGVVCDLLDELWIGFLDLLTPCTFNS
jgi:hypothetical protein